MKTKILIFILAFVTNTQAHAKIGGQEGNGGGGLVRQGVYVTLGTAGFFVNPQPKKALPSLDLIEKAINDLKIESSFKNKILEAVYPVGKREYYDIQQDGVSEAEYAKLVQEYVDLTKYPADKVALFAVTNPNTHVTYLLPAFYKLAPVEQAAILFHEAFWILWPGASYANVVRAEVAFQKWIELADPDAFSDEMAWVIDSLFDRDQLTMNWALSSDLAKDHFSGLMTWFRPPTVDKLFAAVGVKIPDEAKAVWRGNDWPCDVPVPMTAVDAYALSRKFPKSAWLRLLANRLKTSAASKDGLEVVVSYPSVYGYVGGAPHAICTFRKTNPDWTLKRVSVEKSGRTTGKIRIELMLMNQDRRGYGR